MPIKNQSESMDTPKSESQQEKEIIKKAHEQAEIDIQSDPDLNDRTHAGDDLDEGELARLEGGE